MRPDDPNQRLEELFHAALERPAGPERQAYLDGACGGDAELRDNVDALLAAHAEATGFLEEPAVAAKREGPGTTIGPYKLLQEIGEGGMGVVYMAEQTEPVRRKVALKVIKLGMDTKQVISRFEAERQALALMDHANIARVLDAGATDSGRPYFVMELVRGVPIDTYCDQNKLPTRARLELFIDVCRAIQHAHQKGIIHRDLKPSNVLVTSYDGVPVPKIIDFGVAKATNQKLTERTLFTEFRQVIGTPEYMSPEQAEMSGLDVDTRSDIYSLGVLLYQLLTGTTPVDPKELRTAGFEEMTRMIREDEAPAPSTRVSKLGSAADELARSHGSDAGALSKQLRGDLDWIVLRALEKDRTRRYETASDFARDVERHLEDLPVEASPPGALYRLNKVAHRNRRAVTAGAAVLLAVALGLAGTTAGFLRARAEAARSGRIGDSLQEVLAMGDVSRAVERGEVERVLATTGEVFGAEHPTRAAVLDTLAARLHDAGEFDESVELSRQALSIWRQVYGQRHVNAARTLSQLGRTLRAQGEHEGAEQALREAISILGDAESATPLSGFEPRLELAQLLGDAGDFEAADELLEQSLAILRASPEPLHFLVMQTLEQRLHLQLSLPDGDPRETLRELYEEGRSFYPDDSRLLGVWALAYARQLHKYGEAEKAEPYAREAVERLRADGAPHSTFYFSSLDLVFQLLRQRTDPETVREVDELMLEIAVIAPQFMELTQAVENQIYAARRLVASGRFGDALDTLMLAHRTADEGGGTERHREGVRDNLTRLAFEAAIEPDLDATIYAKARAAIDLALAAEPEHPAMRVALGAVLYRQGEVAESVRVLASVETPLSELTGGLARNMAPGDHAFGALALAASGDRTAARAQHDLFLRFLEKRGSDLPPIAHEVAAAVGAPATEQ